MAAEYEIVRDLDAVADVHELSCEHCSTVNRAKATIVALAEALEKILPPAHGLHGGPLVGLKCIYEDGSDENTARHRGWISHHDIQRARTELARLKGDSHAG